VVPRARQGDDIAHFLTPLLRDPDAPWSLIVEDTGEVLASTVETAFESNTRNRGLLGRDSLAEGHALVIAPSNAVHTFFMRFPIDVVFAGRDGRVLKARGGVAPWRATACLKAFAVVETAAGRVDRVRLQHGQFISLVTVGRTSDT
jgi:uncharacterized membrane protein (UPF0127 family)